MNNVIRFACSVFAAALLTLTASAQAQNNPPKREITNIAGDLYRFQNNFHFSVFLVTPEGVIATDPINAEAAKWLADEVKSRFNQPIRFVIYSHDHGDHISGGEVFKQAGALVVSHQQTRADIVANAVSTAVPDITFRDTMTLSLGGKTVELAFLGPSHSDNLIVMRFPEERVLFTVDFISVGSLPFRSLGDGFMPSWVEAIDKAVAMDFDILAPGHGPLGTKQDAMDHGQYIRDLADAVQKGIDADQTVEAMKASISLDAYKDWGQYEAWLPANVEGMHRMLTQ